MNARELTDALGGAWSGSNGSARCPAHDDQQASLSLADGSDGRLLLRCHAGCTFETIIRGLRVRNLLTDSVPINLGRIRFGANGSAGGGAAPPGGAERATGSRIVARYDYTDEAGVVLFQAVRLEPKRFFQRRPDARGIGWIRNLDGVRLVLYHLPELVAASSVEPVYVVEGEKDADRLASLGLVATTNPMGAGKWRPEFSPVLAGRHVVVLPDNDEAGRRHAETVADSVTKHAASVTVVRLPHLNEHGDVSDWLDNGGSLAELGHLVHEARSADGPPPRLVFMPTADLLGGAPRPVPWLLSTPPDDTTSETRGGLLAELETAILAAASGIGKTWLIAELIRALSMGDSLFGYFTVSRPCRVMLIDEESSPWLLRQRWSLLLRGRGVDVDWFAREVFDSRVRIAVDQSFSFDDERALDALAEAALAFRPDVILFETLARIHRRPENDNSQIAALFEDRIKPFKRAVGCGVLFAHHVRKASKESPNDPASMLRGASDLKGQLDEFWYLRGRSGDPRAIFEHDKCRLRPELPSFTLVRETLPDGGVRLTKEDDVVAASAAAEANQEVVLRFLVDNGRQSREQIFAFGKSRGMGQRTVASILAALLERDEVDRAMVGRQAFYWPIGMDE